VIFVNSNSNSSFLYCNPHRQTEGAPQFECCFQPYTDVKSNTEHRIWGVYGILHSLSQSSRTADIGTEVLQPVESLNNNRVHLDSKLSMQNHMTKVAQTYFFQLSRLHQIRHCSVVTSLPMLWQRSCWLDNSTNALLAGLPYSTIAPLQRVINAAMQLVYLYDLWRLRDHITNSTMELHWLTIHVQIQYKMCLLVQRALNYIAELLQHIIKLSTRHTSLWSADKNTLFIPQASLKYGEWAFTVAGPTAWNSLPADIRTLTSTRAFKKKLFTHWILQHFISLCFYYF